jgi:hypothetical protein
MKMIKMNKDNDNDERRTVKRRNIDATSKRIECIPEQGDSKT